MAEAGFALLLQNLQNLGITIFLHLLLFIAVYYGLLRKTEVLGDDEGVVGASAVALGLLTTIGIFTFVPAAFFTQFFGVLSMLLVLVLGMLIVLGMLGVNMTDVEGGDNQRRVISIAIAAIVVIILVVFAPVLGDMIGAEMFGEQQTSFILTLAMIAVLGYMVRYLSGAEA